MELEVSQAELLVLLLGVQIDYIPSENIYDTDAKEQKRQKADPFAWQG